MVDKDGRTQVMISGIVGHRTSPEALKKGSEDAYVVVNGRKSMKRTTKGWELCVQWKDGPTSWEPLSDLKEACPIQVAEYSIDQGISSEPAFSWWVDFVIKKRQRFVSALNKRYHKRTHKFGIELPKTVKEALELDAKNGNHLVMEGPRSQSFKQTKPI